MDRGSFFMKEWYQETIVKIDELMEKLPNVEIRRLQLEYLKTVVKRLDLEAKNCERCEHLKKEVDDALLLVKKAESITEIQRRAYNTRIKMVISHFRKVHQLKQANFYANQFSQYGLLAGVLSGIWFIDHLFVLIALLLLCPFIFRMIGTRIDKRRTDDLI